MNPIINANSILPINIDGTEKSTTRSSHSTDTEPEPEVYSNNNSNIISHIYFRSNIQPKQESVNVIDLNDNGKKNDKNAFEEFIENLPTYEYDLQQIRKNQLKKRRMEKSKKCNPMNMIDTNNNRFLNYYEAFLYIAKHCLKHDQKFTRENCKQYLKQCYIIDFAHDNFIPITTHLTQKLFNKYFRLIQRELKFI